MSASVRVHDGVNTTVHHGVNSLLVKSSYGRVPSVVITDKNLSDRDVRVFAGMADFERSGLAVVGIRWLADYCCIPYQKLAASISRLVAQGHIELAVDGKGRRRQYRLLSPIFAGKAKASTGAVDPTHACAKCGKPGKVDKACYCRSCAAGTRKRFANIDKQVAKHMSRFKVS